ncbi:hypothetical protein L1D15_00040 [Vibrio sp. Isolate25]|uniref:hypothetical protein n=1 Tax=Vibrio sp. Isolate25 TaxID=2908535 RepID=UPI001EFC598B|nr:hypothetical protein [Vibrio sp. Isolate25]MCG9595105.1 hypothetical protein [Vibrio sp. Isolate25]
MRKLILMAFFLMFGPSFADAESSESTNYTFDTQAFYEEVGPSVIDITLTGWTDKPADYIDGNNPDGETYSWPFITVVSNNCSINVTGTNDESYIFESRYGWIFTSKIAPEECDINHITPVPDRNILYFDFKRNEGEVNYDNSMKLRITMKSGEEFNPESFFVIARYVQNSDGGLGFLDEYHISE